MKKEGVHAESGLLRADRNAHIRKGAPNIRPRAWTGLDLLNGRVVPSLTIVLGQRAAIGPVVRAARCAAILTTPI